MASRRRLVRSVVVAHPLPSTRDLFGLRSAAELGADLSEILKGLAARNRFQLGLSSTGLLRPELAFPAYAGLVPINRRAPIFNLFDRARGGRGYSQKVTRRTQRDFRGGRLSYDEHAGTDYVCPPGTPLVAAAPGLVALHRFRWLRGGLTVSVDHGLGVVTQYTHCSKALLRPGERVDRGQAVALSGVSGVDMAGFAPWVPPHIHFTVFAGGRPVDPYLTTDEPDRPGSWLHRNDPAPSGPRPSDPDRPGPSLVDEAALREVSAACLDARIGAEIAEVGSDPIGLAALLEDALFFDEWAWPRALLGTPLRPDMQPGRAGQPETVELTLPLPAAQYDGASFADTPWTTPRAPTSG